MHEAIVSLEKNVTTEEYEFQVRRDHVLEDLLKESRKRSYHPQKRVKTWFVGEDTGGLTRELWHLFGKEIQSLCEGKESSLVPRHDATKLQVNEVLFWKLY